ncbi:MAG: hypothetical protein LBQ70_04290 [Prevotellaceae bacterium]|jgi:peptidoglycan/LPS O-acetylase OafA/YrhL|nr:hypothetical protein [Prevotellaceae bacterium]
MKMSFNFLNQFEYFLFKKYNENHVPVSKTAAFYALVAAVAVVVIVFIMQMINADETVFYVIGGIICGIGLLLSGLKAFPQFQLLTDTIGKITYAVYLPVWYAIIFLLAVYLAVWALIIALVLVVAYFILVYGFNWIFGKK